jgi:serine/threonine protein kinase
MRGRPLPLDVFFRLAIPLAELLGRLHQRNLIHSDVGPTNIIVDDLERLTLVDFESASWSPRRAVGGVPALLRGNLPYLSPEQTGRMNRLAPPFPSRDPVELVHAHLALAPRPLGAVPPILSDIVLRLLAKMPELRYQSAEGLLTDLGRGGGAADSSTREWSWVGCWRRSTPRWSWPGESGSRSRPRRCWPLAARSTGCRG